jgi:uncharacterized protein YjeT (DUF2065 family)
VPTSVTFLLLALGGALFLEGALYALFPDAMKRAMAEVLGMPVKQLRTVGMIVAVIGMIIVVGLLPNM